MLLRHAFENVIINSVKYSSQDASIFVSTTKHASTIRIAIADRGKGIAKYDLSRVREAYYRGPSSKGTSGAGSGTLFRGKHSGSSQWDDLHRKRGW